MQGVLTVDLGAGPVPLDVAPGIYAVSIEVTRFQETETGVTRTTVQESNQVAFSLGPRIDGVDPPNANGRIVVRIVNLFDMLATELDAQLMVDGVVYREAAAFTGVPANDLGTFVRQAGQVEFHPLFDPTQVGTHPTRLVINGAESQPFWTVIP